jgi:hypothetical protein
MLPERSCVSNMSEHLVRRPLEGLCEAPSSWLLKQTFLVLQMCELSYCAAAVTFFGEQAPPDDTIGPQEAVAAAFGNTWNGYIHMDGSFVRNFQCLVVFRIARIFINEV